MAEERIEFDRVTTRNGDDGRSALHSGERLYKDDPLFDAIGDLDELNSLLGLFRHALPPEVCSFLDDIQSTILRLSSTVATSPRSSVYVSLNLVTDQDVIELERYQEALLQRTEIKPVFVNPGATEASALADVCRSVTRRCERRLVALIRNRDRTDLSIAQRYANRLSDLLFVIARYLEQYLSGA